MASEINLEKTQELIYSLNYDELQVVTLHFAKLIKKVIELIKNDEAGILIRSYNREINIMLENKGESNV